MRTARDAVVSGPLTVDARGRPCRIEAATVLVDGPDREGCPWVMDQTVSGLTLLVSTPGVGGVLRDMILWFAQNQQPSGAIPASPSEDRPFADSGSAWVEDLYDYLSYTGDLALGEQLWPNLQLLMNAWYPAETGADGLLVNSLGAYDYAYVPRLGPVVAYYNAAYARALNLAASVAEWLGRPDQAAAWRARIEPLGAAFDRAFWDPRAHAYLDSTSGTPVHPEDGNAFAVLAGLASKRQARAALDYLTYHDNGPFGATIADTDAWDGPPWGDQASQRVYPFMSYFEVLARYAVGFDESALELVRREWGNMARRGSTMWETVNPSGTAPFGSDPSWDHAWSSGAAPALTDEVLGLVPGRPGFGTFLAAPRPSGLRWARGAVPTPHGEIDLSWARTATRFTATIDSPVPGTVVAPVRGAATLDGRRVSAGAGRFRLGAGRHVLVVTTRGRRP